MNRHAQELKIEVWKKKLNTLEGTIRNYIYVLGQRIIFKLKYNKIQTDKFRLFDYTENTVAHCSSEDILKV